LRLRRCAPVHREIARKEEDEWIDYEQEEKSGLLDDMYSLCRRIRDCATKGQEISGRANSLL
jgi:hypothetical protein